ncbi:unnamed protein product [Microthlaspi erraticum]|uniref:F-box domain-containing protein n=1 Tax=Microthlaspi erraticum TaxID=1685480 RepID=A0A6D2J6I7_9BRAS|nr:unnamed protein product [Microthlaspi erraticum]
MDRISKLPDEIGCHIFSFLTTREAASTSVLSKRWRNIFTFTPNLCFENKDFASPSEEITRSFSDFVDRVLAASGESPIKKITLKCLTSGDPAHLNRCMRKFLTHGVTDLDLEVIRGLDYPNMLIEVFACKTIVTLKLGRCFVIENFPENMFLPVLKTLFLDKIMFNMPQPCAFETLFSACPVLELVMLNVESSYQPSDGKPCSTVSCPTLQRLTVNSLDFGLILYRSRFLDRQSFAFDTANLAYLEYSDVVPIAFPVVNLDSLVEAKLGLNSLEVCDDRNSTVLIKGLGNVEVLDLTTFETLETIYYFREAIVVLKNLLQLSITTKAHECWRSLPFLLNKSPNLHTLIIKGPLHAFKYGSVCECFSGYSCFSCPVKVLKITDYGGISGELRQLHHILEKLPCLELVTVCARATNVTEGWILNSDLQRLSKALKCKIEVNFIGI